MPGQRLRYRPVARDDSEVITFMQAYMAVTPRQGFGLLYYSARHQGKLRGKKRLPARIKHPLHALG